MKVSKLSFREARQIPISEYLARLGFEPAAVKGNNLWYHSPFRSEHTPSFKVDVKQNLWYDHGSGEGGSVIDFSAKFHKCTPLDALEKLSDEAAKPFSFHREMQLIEIPDNKVEILAVRNLASPDLLHYLSGRGIDAQTARQHCNEVDFRIAKRKYSAVGFANRSGGYELRNSWFKGSSSPKDISLVQHHADRLSVLEGFMDFLSALKTGHTEIRRLMHHTDVLILNSLNLLTRNYPVLTAYREVNLLLDNDTPAQRAKENLKAQGIPFRDASSLYAPHKDVNEYLAPTQNIVKRKSKGMTR